MAQSIFQQSFFLLWDVASHWSFGVLYHVKSPSLHRIPEILHFFHLDITRLTSIRRFRKEQCHRKDIPRMKRQGFHPLSVIKPGEPYS
jgi:hypothetical protein